MTLAAAVLAATMRVVAPHAYGAPPFSGGFEEDRATRYFHEELNSAGGRVTIEGVPPSFRPDSVTR